MLTESAVILFAPSEKNTALAAHRTAVPRAAISPKKGMR